MVSISRALRQVKGDLPRLIEQHTHQALDEFSTFLWRDRLLNPLVTLLLFITQVMHGNTAITHLRHLSGLSFSATAYCKARRRLPLALLERPDARRCRRSGSASSTRCAGCATRGIGRR